MKSKVRFPLWLGAMIFPVLATLACDQPPVVEVTCLEALDGGSIIAPEQYEAFISTDGGLTWQAAQNIDYVQACDHPSRRGYPAESWIVTDPSNSNIQYRLSQQVSIERSDDGGSTWHQEIDLSGTEARTVYYLHFRRNGMVYRAGPLDAMFDPKTGNLVVAMGYEGVLVRTREGDWKWVGVSDYYRTDMRDLGVLLPVIGEELALALLAGLLTASSLQVTSYRRNSWVIAALIVLIVVLTLTTVAVSSYLWKLPDWLYKLPNWVWTSPISTLLADGPIWSMILILGIPAIPIVIALLAAWLTRQPRRPLFVLVTVGWGYWMTTVLTVANFKLADIDFNLGGLPTLILAVLILPLTIFVLIRDRDKQQRVRIQLGIFAGFNFLVVAIPYFLWGIGGIAHYGTATLLAMSLTLVNLFVGSQMIRRFDERHDRPFVTGT